MPRPAGARNRDFEEKRDALLNTLTAFALNDDLRSPSLRQFALAAQTSEPTLRHYFSDRRGIVIAILGHIHKRALPIWAAVQTSAEATQAAIEQYFRITEAGLVHGGFARAHAFGLIEGMADEKVGRAYLELLLNPALEAVGVKLANTPDGRVDQTNQSSASFMMLAPILVMTLHQQLLGGKDMSPIDQKTFISQIQSLLGSGLADDASH